MGLFKNALFVIRNLPSANALYQSLTEAEKLVNNNLYIDLFTKPKEEANPSTRTLQELIGMVYNRPREIGSRLDIHVLLPPHHICIPRKTNNVLDGCILDESMKCPTILSDIQSSYYFSDFSVKYIPSTHSNMDDIDQGEPRHKKLQMDDNPSYDGVVIGGTFDRMHDGHKLLVATALLYANRKFTCGVADGPLLRKKILKEFIEPVHVRIEKLAHMVNDYKPGLTQKIVPLTDVCGPSGTDDDLQLLVISEETKKGAVIVNETRAENGLQQLNVMCIEMVDDSPVDLSHDLNSEGKLSSSAQRVRLLGTLQRPPNRPKSGNCYLIGLAGGIASGKSSVAKRLEKLGAYIIDCDKLGHQAYLPGRRAYDKIIDHFGEEVLAEDRTVDRKKLGPIVFADKSQLKVLNSIVWPEIRGLITETVEKVAAEGLYDVIVYEAAIIFEAGMDKEANEVWTCVVPIEEAVNRIQARNGLSEEDARSRVSSQMSNEDRVSRSHVVLSTLWEPEFTQTQVEKAWTLLNSRIASV